MSKWLQGCNTMKHLPLASQRGHLLKHKLAHVQHSASQVTTEELIRQAMDAAQTDGPIVKFPPDAGYISM